MLWEGTHQNLIVEKQVWLREILPIAEGSLKWIYIKVLQNFSTQVFIQVFSLSVRTMGISTILWINCGRLFRFEVSTICQHIAYWYGWPVFVLIQKSKQLIDTIEEGKKPWVQLHGSISQFSLQQQKQVCISGQSSIVRPWSSFCKFLHTCIWL